jgi:hypothetical protein
MGGERLKQLLIGVIALLFVCIIGYIGYSKGVFKQIELSFYLAFFIAISFIVRTIVFMLVEKKKGGK